MASRPAVLPEMYSGEGSFTEWIDHFDSVAEVNAWDDAAKSLWIRVRLVGRAQTAFKRLTRTPEQISLPQSSSEGSVRTCKQERTLRGRVPDTTEAAVGRLGIVRRRRKGPRRQSFPRARGSCSRTTRCWPIPQSAGPPDWIQR